LNTDESATSTASTASVAPEGLTVSAAALYRAVLAAPGQSGAALALAAGIGRSTAGKLLTSLEAEHLVRREAGGHDGTRRLPDRWHPATTPQGTPPCAESDESPGTGGTDAGDGAKDGAQVTAASLTGVPRALFEALLDPSSARSGIG
jgi:hypothetical protein